MTNPNPKPSHLHVFTTDTFIPTRIQFDPATGLTKLLCTMLEDFSTEFRANLVMSDGTIKKLDPQKDLDWTPKGDAVAPIGGSLGPAGVFRGVKKGRATLGIGLKEDRTVTATVDIEVLQSDLLVYAPNGKVYRVPGSVWRGDSSTDKKVEVLPWGNPALPPPVWGMLANEVTVANAPNDVVPYPPPVPAARTPAAQPADPPSDNVTCFLLNLNSIALSYSPPRVTRAPKTGGSGSSDPGSSHER